MKRKEKLKKFARKAFPIIGISAISATVALALNARLKEKQDLTYRVEQLEQKLKNFSYLFHSLKNNS